MPFDLAEQILRDLESRVDKTTQLVVPDLENLARRLNVSRSSIKREITSLRNCGYIELQYIKKRPTDRVYAILYKLKSSVQAQNSPRTAAQVP